AEEDTKFGFDDNEVTALLSSDEFSSFSNIKIVGLMGMATYTHDKDQIKAEFQSLKALFDKCRIQNSEFRILSMGMSGDYKLAIECGSNMVRIGSSIFGDRNQM